MESWVGSTKNSFFLESWRGSSKNSIFWRVGEGVVKTHFFGECGGGIQTHYKKARCSRKILKIRGVKIRLKGWDRCKNGEAEIFENQGIKIRSDPVCQRFLVYSRSNTASVYQPRVWCIISIRGRNLIWMRYRDCVDITK